MRETNVQGYALGDNRGMVLILVLVIILATLFIGIVLMKATIVETKITRNDIVYHQEFYQCEDAGDIVLAQFDKIVSTKVIDEKLNTTNDVTEYVGSRVNAKDMKVSLDYVKTANPPVNSGNSLANCFTRYYVIRTEVNGKIIEKGVYKSFPKVEGD
jgi:hypothetical protein